MTKKLLLSAFIATALAASAVPPKDGYYRVQNATTERYIYVTDDKGSVNIAATTADYYAIQLWNELDRAISDPQSIIYLKNIDNEYKVDFLAQGTGVYGIIGHYINILDRGNKGYKIYATMDGFRKDLCDANTAGESVSFLGDSKVTDGRDFWFFHSVDATSDNYFGLRPTVNVGGTHYAYLYADFPFDFASSGLKAYYITAVDGAHGLARFEEVNGIVPPETPVYVKCAGSMPSANRLNLGVEGAQAKIEGNLLNGVYFCRTTKSHRNVTPNDKATMRVLGVTSDGSLGLVTSNDEFLPSNSVYVKVPAGSMSELKIVDAATYEELGDVADVTVDAVEGADHYYTPAGVEVSAGALTPGLYIHTHGNKVEKVLIK